MPAREDFIGAVTRAVALVERAGGEALVFDAQPRGNDSDGRLQHLFTAEREEEWQEFLSECVKFDRELEKEIATTSTNARAPIPTPTASGLRPNL